MLSSSGSSSIAWYTGCALLLASSPILASASSSAENECGLYMATSTIPHAGFGMYAGHFVKKKHRVIAGDIAVPLEEIEWNNDFEDWMFIWDDYQWGGSQLPYPEECDSDGLSVASFGLGAAMNSFLPLVNVGDSWMNADNAGLHRSKDPGAGAFSPFHNRETYASRDVAAGEELFVSYGTNYFQTRTRTYGHIPIFDKDFRKADAIVEKYMKLEEKLLKHDDESSTMTSTKSSTNKVLEGLWDLVTSKLFKDSRALNALPKNHTDIPWIAEKGTRYVHLNRSIQELDWLQENGKCMDNIRPGVSTVPQAGRGAFATRFIPNDGLVAPIPVIHIPYEHRLDMYDPLPTDENGKTPRNTTKPVHQQLLLNYCFGHKNSTLLLSPYGVLTSLINHSSKKPNSRVAWSDISPHSEWTNKSVEWMDGQRHAGLVLEFVALRDIAEGEEILIDYGDEWEQAWQDYVKKWSPPEAKYAERYKSGFELNEDLDGKLWRYDEYPYVPHTLEVYIHDAYVKMSGATIKKKKDYHYARIVGSFVDNDIQKYNVEVFTRVHEDDDGECEDTFVTVVFGVPRDAFYFEDFHYTRDHQMHSSFRHKMMLPDDVFPEAWMNKK